MSVKELYLHALHEQVDYLVVFEDDAVLHSTPAMHLPRVFDIAFMNNRFHGDLHGRVKGGWGNDGYVISRRGLKKMLRILEYAAEPIDLLMMMYTKSLEEYGHYSCASRDRSLPQLECYHVGPLVTHAGYFQSSIGMISQEAREGNF